MEGGENMTKQSESGSIPLDLYDLLMAARSRISGEIGNVGVHEASHRLLDTLLDKGLISQDEADSLRH